MEREYYLLIVLIIPYGLFAFLFRLGQGTPHPTISLLVAPEVRLVLVGVLATTHLPHVGSSPGTVFHNCGMQGVIRIEIDGF